MPLSEYDRAKHLETFVQWLAIRRENTTRMVEALGLHTDAREAELFGPDETPFRELMNLVGESCSKELDFLAQAGFPGIAFVEGDDDEEIAAFEALLHAPTTGLAQ